MTSLPSIGYTKKIELILSTPGRLRVPVDPVASVQRFAPLPSVIDAFPEDAPNQGTRRVRLRQRLRAPSTSIVTPAMPNRVPAPPNILILFSHDSVRNEEPRSSELSACRAE